MNDKPISPSVVRQIPVEGVTLNITEYGADAEPLFLLHGIGSRVTSWWPVIDQLALQFRLIAPDLRGHGGSDRPDTGYLISDYAADLDALFSSYGATQPKIVGHSLGGMIALNWATRNPDRARSIVIEDSPLQRADDPEQLFDGWIRQATMPLDELAAEFATIYPCWSESERQRRAVSITSTALPVFIEMKAQNMKDDGADRIAPLAVIRTPMLLVYGDTEVGGMVSESDAQRFAATVPNAKLAHIPGGTHSLHRDFPDTFLDVTLPFLLGTQG